MEDELTRAQHYRVRAAEMREASRQESDIKRRTELLELSNQYDRLAEKLIENHRAG
jgi:hypothetical protein